MDADPVTLAGHQSSVERQTISIPSLIYFDPEDAERTLRAIAEQRGPARDPPSSAPAEGYPRKMRAQRSGPLTRIRILS